VSWTTQTFFHPVLGRLSEVTNGTRRILIAGTDHEARAKRRMAELNAVAPAACSCHASDSRVCRAVRNPTTFLGMDEDPRCTCGCH